MEKQELAHRLDTFGYHIQEIGRLKPGQRIGLSFWYGTSDMVKLTVACYQSPGDEDKQYHFDLGSLQVEGHGYVGNYSGAIHSLSKLYAEGFIESEVTA